MMVLPWNDYNEEAAAKSFIFPQWSLVFSKLWNIAIPGLMCAHPLPAGTSVRDDHVFCISSNLQPKA